VRPARPVGILSRFTILVRGDAAVHYVHGARAERADECDDRDYGTYGRRMDGTNHTQRPSKRAN
jgi:hypothetical protein